MIDSDNCTDGDTKHSICRRGDSRFVIGDNVLEGILCLIQIVISSRDDKADAVLLRQGEDLAAEELAALYAEDDARKKAQESQPEPELEPEPEPEEKGVDAESVLREADLILAASAAIV